MSRQARQPKVHAGANRLVLGGLLCVAGLGLAGCQSITADGPEAAQVRFVDASVDAPELDLYLNTTGAAYGLSFGTVTSYIPVSPGEYRISANRASTPQPLIAARTALGGTRQYTAVVSNALGNLQETIYPDTNTPAPQGTVAVRILNEAVDAGPLDVYLVPSAAALPGASAAFHGLAYTADSGYLDLPAGMAYTIAVAPAGSGAASASVLSGITLTGASGAVRTLVLSGPPVGSGKGLTGFVLEDADPA